MTRERHASMLLGESVLQQPCFIPLSLQGRLRCRACCSGHTVVASGTLLGERVLQQLLPLQGRLCSRACCDGNGRNASERSLSLQDQLLQHAAFTY
jgi:hypothetical protein